MSDKYLIDTNILIYYFNGVFPKDNHEIDELFEKNCNISIISKIEFLGWAGFRDEGIYRKAKEFLENASLYYLDDDVAEETIKIRKKYKIVVPDAIIAATAVVNDFVLVTNNTDDFKNIGLEIINPL